MPEIQMTMTFDDGHRIVGHKGKCARLHGHTYKIEITCIGSLDSTSPGFVVDFGDLKSLVNEWDHRFLVWDQDPIWRCNLIPRAPDEALKHEEQGFTPLHFN